MASYLSTVRCSDSMFPPNRSTRSASLPASSSTTLWSSPEGQRGGVQTTVLTGKACLVKPQSAGMVTEKKNLLSPDRCTPRRAESGDNSVDNDTKKQIPAAKMAEKMEYYVQERKTVHLQIQQQWKRKLSTGWTINRPLLYPKNSTPAPPEYTLGDTLYCLTTDSHVEPLPSKLAAHSKNVSFTSVKSDHDTENGKPANLYQNTSSLKIADRHKPDMAQHFETDDANGDISHENEARQFENEERRSQCIIVTTDGSVNKVNSINSKSTQWGPEDKVKADEHKNSLNGAVDEAVTTATDLNRTSTIMRMPRSRFKPVISNRSTSNSLLNVLSIDDCKMNLRYRPQRMIYIQHEPAEPPPTPLSTQGLLGEFGEQQIGTDNEKIEGVGVKDRCQDVETKVFPASSTLPVPIRLSQEEGSVGTALSPGKAQAHASKNQKMQAQYSKLTSQSKGTRPSSATVEKAFSILLDEKFQACQSKQRPHSSPVRLAESKRTSRSTNTPKPSARFQKLNASLRQQMCDYIDSRWLCMKVKAPQINQVGFHIRTEVERRGIITSSPKGLMDSNDGN